MTPIESPTLNMVQCQIAPNGITHPDVLDAFLSIDRTAFVPGGYAARALSDDDVVVDGALVMLKPLTLAVMIQALANQDARGSVAVIGDETGYVATLLRSMGFAALPVSEESALLNGAPWQGVIMHGAVSELPPFLFTYLAEGGLVLAVVQASGAALGDVIAATSLHDKIVLAQAGAPPLRAFIKTAPFAL